MENRSDNHVGIAIRVVTSAADLRTYLLFPSVLNRDYPFYVPPLWKEERHFHDPSENKQLSHCDTIRFLAWKGPVCVGRIMGIIHHVWNNRNEKKFARFYQPEFIDDPEVSVKLLNAVENWALEKGMKSIIGSFGLSDKDPQGIQLEGFEIPPVIASVSHQPYIAKHLVEAGYSKFKDCVSYVIPIPVKLPEVYKMAHNRILKNSELRLLSFSRRRDLRPYFKPVMELMNEAYEPIFGFEPMSKTDIEDLANQYLAVIDPRLVKVVVDLNGKPVSFVIAMGNISRGLQRSRGKLFPFGFIFLLLAMRKPVRLDLLLGAVRKEYRGRGLNVLMGVSLMETARKMGMETMDSHLILEENYKMRSELEHLGGTVSKRYRIFIKELS